MCSNGETIDQDNDDDLDREHELLASLIDKLKCEIDDSHNHNKFLESSNKILVDNLKREIKDCKTKNQSLESSNNHFKEANNELSNINDLMFKDLKKYQAELDRYNDVNYASMVEIDCEKAKGDLMEYYYANHMSAILGVYTRLDEFTDLYGNYMDKVNECCLESKLTNQSTNVSNQCLESENIYLKKTIVKLKKDFSRMEAHCVAIELKHQNQFLQTSQHGHVLKDIDSIEIINIELEHSVAKLLQQNEILHKENDTVKRHYKELYDSIKLTRNQTKVKHAYLIEQLNRKSSEVTDLKAQLQDKTYVNVELRTLLNKMKGKFVKSKFEKQLFVHQLNDFKSHKQSVLGNPTPFLDSLEKKVFTTSSTKTSVSNDVFKQTNPYIMPSKMNNVYNNTNMIAPGMYRMNTRSTTQTRTPQLPQDSKKTNKRVSFSIRVNSTTSVSRPQLKSTHLEDRVMLNNSQGIMKKVEDHYLEVAFRKSTGYIRDLKGNDLLTSSRSTDLYSITL
ncbi:hypothetical protein Tco_1341661 [Tanacetum coccineum]